MPNQLNFLPLRVTGLIDKVEGVDVIQPHFNKSLKHFQTWNLHRQAREILPG